MFQRIKKLLFCLTICVLAGLELQGCGKVELSAKSVEIELGSAASTDILDYIDITQGNSEQFVSDAILELSAIDTMTVEEYEAVVTYKEQEIVIPVKVVDTTPPVVQMKDTVFVEGDQVEVYDLAEVCDLSKVSLTCSNDDHKNADIVILYPDTAITIEAVDEFGNKTTTEISPNVIKDDGNLPRGRRFVYFSKFPYYEEDNYVNEDIFAILKAEYSKLDWQCEFETGNLNEYDFYKGKYRELITNQKLFYDCETEEELYLKDYSVIKSTDMDSYDSTMEMYNYYLFDMDQDDMPELCIKGMTCIVIFKYDRDNDSFLMWKAYKQTSYYGLLGSRTAYFRNPGLASGEDNIFYKLDKDGKEIYMVTFKIGYYVDSQTDDWDEAYMVAFPYYVDKDRHIELSEEIKRQGFLCDENQEYYFRITKEQFDELTKGYYTAIEQAPEKLELITYTYEEFMGQE